MLWDDDKADRYEGAGFRAWMWCIVPEVIATRVEGHVDASAVRFYTARVDRALLPGVVLRVFHDWSGITGFDRDIRDAYRSWAETKAGLVAPHFFLDSKILSMAVSVTGMVLGQKLVVFQERAPFHAAAREAFDEAQRRGRTRSLPPPPSSKK